MHVRVLGWEDPLEKDMETHSSLLAWTIPWTEEPGRLQPIGSHRVRHDWSDLARSTCAYQFRLPIVLELCMTLLWFSLKLLGPIFASLCCYFLYYCFMYTFLTHRRWHLVSPHPLAPIQPSRTVVSPSPMIDLSSQAYHKSIYLLPGIQRPHGLSLTVCASILT